MSAASVLRKGTERRLYGVQKLLIERLQGVDGLLLSGRAGDLILQLLDLGTGNGPRPPDSSPSDPREGGCFLSSHLASHLAVSPGRVTWPCYLASHLAGANVSEDRYTGRES